MFSRQTFWLLKRRMKPSILEGATKQGSKHFFRSTRGMFPLISQWSFRASATLRKSHRLSSLLHGVIVLTNSSLRPTKSAKQTFFGLVGAVLFCCVSVFIAALRFLLLRLKSGLIVWPAVRNRGLFRSRSGGFQLQRKRFNCHRDDWHIQCQF